MERRAFFKTCFAAFAAPLAVPLTAIATRRHTPVIQKSSIAGLQHHAGEALSSDTSSEQARRLPSCAKLQARTISVPCVIGIVQIM